MALVSGAHFSFPFPQETSLKCGRRMPYTEPYQRECVAQASVKQILQRLTTLHIQRLRQLEYQHHQQDYQQYD